MYEHRHHIKPKLLHTKCTHLCHAVIPIQWRYDERDGVSIVYLTGCSGTDQRKHQSSASLAFVRGFPAQRSVTRKMFPFDYVIMQTMIWYACRNQPLMIWAWVTRLAVTRFMFCVHLVHVKKYRYDRNTVHLSSIILPFNKLVSLLILHSSIIKCSDQ